MQREALRLVAAEPLHRLGPGRMAWHIVIAESGNGLRVDLDPPRRGVERRPCGVRAEIGERDRRARRRRNFEMAGFPKGVEARHLDAVPGDALAVQVVEMAQPFHLAAALGEGVRESEPPREAGIYVVFVARPAHRVDGLLAGDNEAVELGCRDVVAFERGRAGQHDIGPLGRRRPPGLVDDDRVRSGPALEQVVQILVLVERVTAAPVDQPDVGVAAVLSVEAVGRARVEQHVRQPRDRDRVGDGVGSPGKPGRRHLPCRVADAVHGAVAEAEPAAGQADLAQHRRQSDGHPVGLLAAVGALDRPADADQRARRCHPTREAANCLGRYPGNTCGPVGVAGGSVRPAEKVGGQPVEPGAIAGEETGVVQPFVQQCVREPQHHREVGIGPDGKPLGPDVVRRVVADRTDAHEPCPGLRCAPVPVGSVVGADSSLVDHGVLGRHAAERHHQPGVLDDRGPCVDRAEHRLHRADDTRNDDARRTDAEARYLVHEAAMEVEETRKLAAGIVEDAGAAPAGAAVNGFVAARPPNPLELGRHKVERAVPAHPHERLGAACGGIGARPVFQPGLAHGRRCDPALGMDRIRKRPDERRRAWILVERPYADQPPVFRLGREGAPMACPECGLRPVRHVRSPCEAPLP